MQYILGIRVKNELNKLLFTNEQKLLDYYYYY